MAEEATGEIARQTAALVSGDEESDVDPFADLKDEEELKTNEVVIEDRTD